MDTGSSNKPESSCVFYQEKQIRFKGFIESEAAKRRVEKKGATAPYFNSL